MPVCRRLSRLKIAYAASAMIAGLRLALKIAAGKFTSIAAVAIVVRGHNELTAMPCSTSSADMPSVHMLMPYLDMVYAVWFLNHFASMLSGGERLRIWGLPAFIRCGMHACEHANVPRTLTPNIRSKRFIGVCNVPVS